MSFPAWDAFDEDDRVRRHHVRLYRFARRTLDFREIRLLKQAMASEKTGLDRKEVRLAINDLVAWGYLVEHARAEQQARQFTLAWSVHPARRWGNIPPTQSHGGARGAA